LHSHINSFWRYLPCQKSPDYRFGEDEVVGLFLRELDIVDLVQFELGDAVTIGSTSSTGVGTIKLT
jgi:hypothetical protein